MDLINAKSKRNGKIAATVYAVVLIIFMFLKTCSAPTEDYSNEGVIVNLGFTETGKSDNKPEAVQEEIQEEVTPQEQVEEVVSEVVEESVTQETEVVDVTASEEVTPEVAETIEEVVEEVPTEVTPEVTETEEVVEEQPQVDESALFTNNNNNPNQGEGTENGDQGNPDGSLESNIYGDITGPGLGETGKGWGLNGRSLGHKPTPVSDKQEYGIVTIKIRVGKNGKVISAQFSNKGSTTLDKYLIDLSIREAKKVTFNPDPKAPEVQIGFVSFHYKAS